MTNTTPTPKPISGVKHFWLSFLAVITGVPVSLLVVFGGGMLILAFFVAVLAASLPQGSDNGISMYPAYGRVNSGSKLVAVPVHGPILSGSAASPLQTIFGGGLADGELIKEQLMVLAEDDSVDGVVLEIDSPGGMITASKALSDGIKYYREQTGKPIISHINGMGASGAYWAASTTDAIYAEQGSEAGSIGVIMGPLARLKGIVSYDGVSTNEPITFRYFTAGRSKDLGSPFRDITAEEEAFLNSQLADEYEKFVAHVAENRDIPAATIKGTVGALAYGTDKAIELKLIDGEMSKEAAYKELAARTGSENRFHVMRIDNTADFFGSLFGVKRLISNIKMSESDKSAARTRFCETNLVGKPLVFSGDLEAVCK